MTEQVILVAHPWPKYSSIAVLSSVLLVIGHVVGTGVGDIVVVGTDVDEGGVVVVGTDVDEGDIVVVGKDVDEGDKVGDKVVVGADVVVGDKVVVGEEVVLLFADLDVVALLFADLLLPPLAPLDEDTTDIALLLPPLAPMAKDIDIALLLPPLAPMAPGVFLDSLVLSCTGDMDIDWRRTNMSPGRSSAGSGASSAIVFIEISNVKLAARIVSLATR